jgi:hypothetical protein
MIGAGTGIGVGEAAVAGLNKIETEYSANNNKKEKK